MIFRFSFSITVLFQHLLQISIIFANTSRCTSFVRNPTLRTVNKTTLEILKLEKSFDLDSFPFDRAKTKSKSIVPTPEGSDLNNKDLGEILADYLTLSSVDIQSRKTIVMKKREYTKKEPFEYENLCTPSTLKDLSPPRSELKDIILFSAPAIALSFVTPFLSFPYLVQFLDYHVTIDTKTLGEIASKFGPGVSILYGTFVSITLSLLYKRQEGIQDLAAKESAHLAVIMRNLLTLYKKDQDSAVIAGQCIADQIRTLSIGSRGEELTNIRSSDPYGRLIDLLHKTEEKWIEPSANTKLKRRELLLGRIRENIEILYELRASRLSQESLSLPPTHFFILKSLTFLILLGYTVGTLPSITMTEAGAALPPNESSLLFGLLCTVYLLFYNSASDLNEPFCGIYQIRRAAIASHLMETKWLIVDHPLLKGKVDFKGSVTIAG